MFFMKDSARTKESYQRFHQQKAEIKDDFDDKLGWIEEHGEKRVYLKRTGMKTKDEASWPEQHEWLASALEKFEAVFRPRIESRNSE